MDLTAGADYDVTVPPFGGSADYAFTVDGRALVFTAKVGADRAWHTNSDIYEVPLTGIAQDKLGRTLGANIIGLGVVSGLTGAVSMGALGRARRRE